jgi:hypothetical protein
LEEMFSLNVRAGEIKDVMTGPRYLETGR